MKNLAILSFLLSLFLVSCGDDPSSSADDLNEEAELSSSSSSKANKSSKSSSSSSKKAKVSSSSKFKSSSSSSEKSNEMELNNDSAKDGDIRWITWQNPNGYGSGISCEVYDDTTWRDGGSNECTYNNNGAIWSSVACDAVFSNPRICYEHSLTSYTLDMDSLDALGPSYGVMRLWGKYDTMPWYSEGDVYGLLPMNIFPILDTMFGKPCAAVSNLQAVEVEVDTLCATVMWSADARHHYWEVEYCATGLPPDSARVVTVEVPTVTLTGLAPGTEYSVAVRGQCDIFVDNYSPWGDTLLFTTPQPPQDTTPDTLPWVTPFTLGAHGMGNLDRFTRIMPNPASEVVNVLSSYRLESVAVYDLMGRLVLEQPAEGLSATIGVSALPKGVYVVAIRTLQGVATKRLVVE